MIVHDTLDRAARYREFQTGPTSEPAELNGEKGVRITLRFLVSVRILDMCVDLPECDAVGLLSPPTKHADVKSAPNSPAFFCSTHVNYGCAATRYY